jgi:hypothetical protein
VLENCRFEGNAATGGDAGGIRIVDSGALLTDCVFTENTAIWFGGALQVMGTTDPVISDCKFYGNSAEQGGALAAFALGTPVETCTFEGNWVDGDNGWGGAVFVANYTTTVLRSCTFNENAAYGPNKCGACVFVDWDSDLEIEHSILAFSTSAEAVCCNVGCSATLTCCDVYGNAGGDYVACIAGQDLVRNNFSLDPLFCGTFNPPEPLTLDADSPCAAANNPACGLVGAWPIGCDPACPGFTSIQICGDFNGWDTNVESMTQVAECMWADTLTVTAGCYYFKFRTENAWDSPQDYGNCGAEDPTCNFPASGPVCLVSGVGTALGLMDFPTTTEYLFFLDEVAMTYTVMPLASGIETPIVDPPTTRLLSCRPNPLRERTTITYDLATSGQVSVRIFDLAGRVVRTLEDAHRTPGSYSLTWDARDDQGHVAPAGVYLYRLEHGRVKQAERVLLVR